MYMYRRHGKPESSVCDITQEKKGKTEQLNDSALYSIRRQIVSAVDVYFFLTKYRQFIN